MEFEAQPEPPPEHAAALRKALGAVVVDEPARALYRSGWRLAAVLENVDSEAAEEEDLRSDGASRA